MLLGCFDTVAVVSLLSAVGGTGGGGTSPKGGKSTSETFPGPSVGGACFP
jgi:hypothetical protein